MCARLILLVFLCSFAMPAAPPYVITVDRSVSAKMRDGVSLRADIYHPAVEGTFPVLLQRTPYNKDGGLSFGVKAAALGFVVVIQDVRGRYSSPGEWYPFKHESDDGYDTVEWAAALPYSNGKVGMFGGSYVGATQMLAAITHPPHLAGICPVVTASNYHDNWTYQGGAFEQWFNESWTSGLAQDTFDHTLREDTNAMKQVRDLPLAEYHLFNFGEISSNIRLTRSIAPYFLDWLAHPGYDDFWRRWSIQEHYGDITVPALTVAAWYDLFQGGSLLNYMGLKEHAGNEAARRNQHLIVAIGGHSGFGQKVGALDFGAGAAFDEQATTIAWYEYLFHNAQNEFADQRPVRIFVMGRNEWRDEDEWPLKRARVTPYFLHSEGHANSAKGDGNLTPVKPEKNEAADHFTYDPSNPAPTVGGPLCCDSDHLAPGPRDQRPVEARADVLVYSTARLPENMEVTGPVSLEIYVKSSAVDTDFTAKLVDVRPDGFAQNLTEGILRARYRDSQTTPSRLVPGHTYKLAIDLWSTSNVFLKGHRLRLEVSSSNFPRFDRNLNTGGDFAHPGKPLKAINSVLHDAEHSSVLMLPVVPAKITRD